MDHYGVFISHSHLDWAIAGRIYDFLSAKGLYPFLDVSSMRQCDFHKSLENHVKQSPYFLCVLTRNTFLKMDSKSWVYKEIRVALQSKRELLLLAEKDFTFPENLPFEIKQITHHHCYEFDRSNFLDVMEKICTQDIQKEKIFSILNWRQNLYAQRNVYLTSRKEMENSFATLEKRFGEELVRCVRVGEEFTGENRIKYVHMSCYAASIIFSPHRNMIDDQAFDRGLMFNIFAELLKDEDFSLEIIINAPNSLAAQDAIDNEKLGNSALEAFPEAIFLSSYCNINRLVHEDPVFQKAYKSKRFRFLATESVLPYALFHIAYKPGYEEDDHIKIDFYSEGIRTNMERRTMLIFKKDDWGNYRYFEERYAYIRNVKESKRLTSENHEKWLAEWEKLRSEIE